MLDHSDLLLHLIRAIQTHNIPSGVNQQLHHRALAMASLSLRKELFFGKPVWATPRQNSQEYEQKHLQEGWWLQNEHLNHIWHSQQRDY